MKIPFAFWGQAESELPIVGGVKVIDTPDFGEVEIQYTLIDEGKNGPVWSYGIVYSKLFPNVTLDTPGAQVKTLGTSWPSNLPVTNTDIITGLDDTTTYYFRVFATNGPSGVQPTAENTFYSNTATGETKWKAFEFSYDYQIVKSQIDQNTPDIDFINLGHIQSNSSSGVERSFSIQNLTGPNQQVFYDFTLGNQAIKVRVAHPQKTKIYYFTSENNGTRAINIPRSDFPYNTGNFVVSVMHDDSVADSTFNNFRFSDNQSFNNGDHACNAAIRILQWGPSKWKSWEYMFQGDPTGAGNPSNNSAGIGTPIDQADLSECTTWESAFRYNHQAWSGDNPNEQKLGDIGSLENIKTIASCFAGSRVCTQPAAATSKPLKDANWDSCQNFFAAFDQLSGNSQVILSHMDLSGWDIQTDDVISMAYMFNYNQHVTTRGIGNWDVSKVITMEYMFGSNSAYDEDLSSWDTGEVENMRYMFHLAYTYDQDLSGWDVALVTKQDGFYDNPDPNVWPVARRPVFPFIATNANIQSAVDAVLAVDSTGTTAVAPYPLIGEWNTSQVTDMSELFRFKQQFNADISNWDVSNVTTMRQMFDTASDYNQPLNSWDTSSVTNIFKMFHNCYDFNQPLNNWNVSGVSGTNGSHVFRYCESFNQDLDQWDVSNFTSFEEFFFRCKVFNGDITNWDVSSATTMESMFQIAHAFNRDISGWDVSNVEDMEDMFGSALVFNQPIGSWNVSNVTNMKNMFIDAYDFNQSLNSWDVSNVTNMQAMFAAYNNYSGQGPGTFNQPLDQWDVSNVTDMSNMFHTQGAFNQDISGWDISSLTGNGMEGMFSKGVFNQPLNNWTLPAGVTSLRNMFSRSDYNQPLDNWDVSGITDMSILFWNSEFNQDISGWDVSSVTDMTGMFQGNQAKFNQPIGNWDTSSVVDMQSMFNGNIIFDQDISTWPTTTPVIVDKMFKDSTYNRPLPNWKIDGTDFNAMRETFRGNTNFDQDISGWDVSDANGFSSTFREATSFNQDLSSWDVGGATNFSGTFNGATSYDQSFNGWQFERNETYGLSGFSFLAGVTLSTANYDDTLVAWASMMQTLYPNGAGSGAGQFKGSSTFDFGNSVHTTGGPAEAGKETLINDYNFTITDGNP